MILASLSQMKSLLSEWSEKGDFSFSSQPADWEKQERKIWDREEGYQLVPYYFGVAISHILENEVKATVFSSCKNKWDWVNGLLVLIPSVDWDANQFLGIVSSFQSKSKKKNDVELLISNTFRVYCKCFFDEGLSLMESEPNHSIDCLAGLLMNDFDRACRLFSPEKDKELFAQAFIRTEGLDNKTVCKAFDIAVSLKPFDESVTLAFLLKTLVGLEDGRKTDCEKRIKVLLSTKSSSMTNVLCNWLYRQSALSPVIEDFVLLALAHLEHPTEDIKRLDNVLFLCLINEGFFGKIAVLVSEQYGPNEILSFENCLQKLHNETDSFVNLVLSFVLHLKGDYRSVGRQLWDEYHMENSGFDPLSLNEGEQILFVVFMLQDLGNPEKRLPKILPLFLSASERVRQVLLAQMIPYVDNYMGNVSQAMEKLGLDTKETKLLKQYVEDRAEAIQKRRGLKELSPKYTQDRYYQEACRVEREEHGQHIKAIEEDSSFLWMKMMKTEVLARGGGWRLENGKTNHLSKIEVSVPTRLMVPSMTPLERDKWINDVFKDWDVTERDH
jgi:hypothetical protein